MNPISPNATEDEILTQAADWCLRLHGEDCSAADRAAFALWIQADPRHALEFGKMLEIWELSSELPHHLSTAESLLTISSPRHKGTLEI